MKRSLFLILWPVVAIYAGCTPAAVSAPPPLIETGIDPESWTTIPAGEFLMGQHEHETNIPYDYEIMVTDVTNAQYAHFINEAFKDGSIGFDGLNPVGFYPGDVFRGYKHEKEIAEGWYQLAALDDPGARISFDGSAATLKSRYESHPVTMVTWFGARAYCEYYGWRLPTETEWEKAARGEDPRPFPWGYEIRRNQANYYSSYDIFEKLAGKSDTSPVGFYNGKVYNGYETVDGSSPYGLYDMAGNVWQWTGDVYENQHYRYMRGGSKDNYAYNLRVWTRNSAGPEYFSPSVGFRCVREP
jgi:formylglycine-generating enzyme required for sulfatase activity